MMKIKEHDYLLQAITLSTGNCSLMCVLEHNDRVECLNIDNTLLSVRSLMAEIFFRKMVT